MKVVGSIVPFQFTLWERHLSRLDYRCGVLLAEFFHSCLPTQPNHPSQPSPINLILGVCFS